MLLFYDHQDEKAVPCTANLKRILSSNSRLSKRRKVVFKKLYPIPLKYEKMRIRLILAH